MPRRRHRWESWSTDRLLELRFCDLGVQIQGTWVAHCVQRQYDELEADVVYKPDGQLRLQLQIKGNSPGLHATRPLHLNLNLDQNILSLVESLRAVNGLNDRIDSAVKKHFKAPNR